MSDLILYAAIACVLCLMLFFVLGKDVGESPDKKLFDKDLSLVPVTEPQILPSDPHFSGPAGKGLTLISQADSSFSPAKFLDGAGAAYSMILEGYAEGDKETLKGLLDDAVYEAYAAGIDEREAKNLTQSTDLARLISSKLISAERAGSTGKISVEFDAEIAAAIYDTEGTLVEGDPDLLSRVVEVWTFERTLASDNPNWLLVSVTESGEDTFGSAPDFTPEKET